MAKLKFKLDAEGQPLKVGMGMYSKEDEYVDFDKECDCSGQVSYNHFKCSIPVDLKSAEKYHSANSTPRQCSAQGLGY